MKYRIPATWQMYGWFEVEAENLQDAVDQIEDLPLPKGSYVDDSFEIDSEMLVDDYPDEDFELI